MDSATESPDQVRHNYDAYNERYRADLEQSHWGKTAIMHDGEVVLILNDSDDAYTVGQSSTEWGTSRLCASERHPRV